MDYLSYLESLELWDHKSKFCLRNVQLVLDDLDNPENQPKVIHIGGTNGKGTVSVALASILNAAGYSVGLNISPHLLNVRERISLNGELINELALSDYLEQIQATTQKLDVQLTYHEVLTVAAFLAFKTLDYAVIEVGLGGRFDASNCIKSPLLSIITSISLDHTAILGKSVDKIAKEKAGIIKSNSRLLVGDLPELAKPIIYRFCRKQNSELIALDDLDQLNATQINQKIAKEAAKLLGIPNKYIAEGVDRYYWPARMEKLEVDGSLYLVDAAHNPAAMVKLIEYLKEVDKVQLLFGALKTKEWQSMIDGLLVYTDQVILLESASNASVPACEIAKYLSRVDKNLIIENYGKDYAGAIQASKNYTGLNLITGSLYLIGDLRPHLNDQQIKYW